MNEERDNRRSLVTPRNPNRIDTYHTKPVEEIPL